MLAMSDNSGGVTGGKVKKPRKRYDILKTASCSVCGNFLSLKVNIKILFFMSLVFMRQMLSVILVHLSVRSGFFFILAVGEFSGALK